MNRDETIALFELWGARHKGKRGRPPEDSVSDLETGLRAIVIEVFVEERALGRRRGDLTKAIREVVARCARRGITHRGRALDEENLRTACKRHRNLRWAADFKAYLAQQERDIKELRRRMRGFPPNVREWLGPVPVRKLVKFLRAEGIDGDCPDWFIEEARAKQATTVVAVAVSAPLEGTAK